MLRTILLISLAALSFNAFADCETNTNKVEVFTKAKESRKVEWYADEAISLARESAGKTALQDCVMKGAKDCQIIGELSLCESKKSLMSSFSSSNYYIGECTVVVRGYKTVKSKKNDFDNLCED